MRAAPRAASASGSETTHAHATPLSSIALSFVLRRLRTRAQFQAVLAGATVARTAHFALHRLEFCAAATAQAPFPHDARLTCWIGAMTPKRWARRAVTRNSIRRQIYNVGESFEDRLGGAAHVVRQRAAFDRAKFVSATSDALKRAVRAELLQLFARLPARAAAPQAAPQ